MAAIMGSAPAAVCLQRNNLGQFVVRELTVYTLGVQTETTQGGALTRCTQT